MLLMQNDDPIAGGGLPVIHITQAQYDANPSAYNDPNVLVHIKDAVGGNLQGKDVSYDSTLKFNNIGDIATKSLAKVEPSDTALYAHAVGTYFINKDGEYCVTDSAIAVNGTITKGTNCHVVTVGDELSSINSKLTGIVMLNGITPGQSGSYTFNNSMISKAFVIFIGRANAVEFGAIYIHVSEWGNTITPIVENSSSNYNISLTDGTLTITNNTTNSIQAIVMYKS